MFLNGKMTYLGSDIIGKNVSHTLSKTEFFFFSFLFLCSRIVGQRSMLMVDAFRIPQEKKKKKEKKGCNLPNSHHKKQYSTRWEITRWSMVIKGSGVLITTGWKSCGKSALALSYMGMLHRWQMHNVYGSSDYLPAPSLHLDSYVTVALYGQK